MTIKLGDALSGTNATLYLTRQVASVTLPTPTAPAGLENKVFDKWTIRTQDKTWLLSGAFTLEQAMQIVRNASPDEQGVSVKTTYTWVTNPEDGYEEMVVTGYEVTLSLVGTWKDAAGSTDPEPYYSVAFYDTYNRPITTVPLNSGSRRLRAAQRARARGQGLQRLDADLYRQKRPEPERAHLRRPRGHRLCLY